MTHDEKCEVVKAWLRHQSCGCADRAIAKARREARIEGYALCDKEWRGTIAYDYIPAGRQDAEMAVDAEWPEDKTNDRA